MAWKFKFHFEFQVIIFTQTRFKEPVRKFKRILPVDIILPKTKAANIVPQINQLEIRFIRQTARTTTNHLVV
ncbi:hypothetical protein D3C86_2194950 [compost metagenome]